MYSQLALFIDGQWKSDSAGPGQDVINPATEKAIATVPHATGADLDAAVDAATKGLKVWSQISAYDRCIIMRKAAALIRERLDFISNVLVQEQGKVLAEATIETSVSADVVDWYAEEGRRSYGRIVPGRTPHVRQLVLREPVGIVAAFTPWNFPILTPARKIAGALGAGCSIIIKASEETPGACVEMVRCFADAGLPNGVLNLVFGIPSQISEYLLQKTAIKKVSFTGSTTVGKHLAGLAARTVKRSTMELGGHAPVIVFDDVDPGKVINTIAPFKFRNAGQVCISPTRFFVHESVYKPFVAQFIDYAKSISVGDGMKAGVTMGPLANPRRLDEMDTFVADARSSGGTIATGGGRLGNQGYFFEPTVITDIPDSAKVMKDEPFGPLAPIVPFKTFDEVVERANSLEYGLAAYAFTTSNKTATAIGDSLQSGMVGINSVAISTPETPFGGIKDSGHGSEGGLEGLDAYLNTKFISQA